MPLRHYLSCEQQLQLFREQAHSIGILILDPNGIISIWTPSMEKITGWNENEAVGQAFNLLFTPEDIAAGIPENELKTAFVSQKVSDCRWHVRKDGTLFYSDGLISSLSNETGENIGYVKVMHDITRLKQVEEQLRLSSDVAGLGIWTLDLQTKEIVWENERMHEILGLPRTSAPINLEQFLTEYIHPEDAGKARQALTEAIRTGERTRIETRMFRQPNRELRWIEISGLLRHGHGNTGSQIIGALFDITDRKCAEMKLRSSEERYRTLFNSIDQGFGIIEVLYDAEDKPVDGRILEVNPAFTAMAEGHNVVGKTIREIEPETDQHWFDFYHQVLTTGTPSRIVAEFRPKLQWIDAYAIPIREGNSKKVAVLFSDITERKCRENELHASEERFRLLAEMSPDGILVEANEQFVYANHAITHLLGYASPEELVGLTAFDIVEPSFHDRVHHIQFTVLESRQTPPLTEMRLKRKDGTGIDVQISAAGVSWKGQPAIQILLRDVSEQKQIQNKLQAMNERIKLVVEGTGEGVWDWNIQNHSFTYSGGLKTILGLPGEKPVYSENEWTELIHPEDLNYVLSTFERALQGLAPYYFCEYRFKAKDGSWRWVRARGMIVERDDQGQPLLMSGTMVDITAKKESEEQAWKHANLDSLTNLPNRRHFREKLEFELRKAKRNHLQLALLYIDLDGFKQVNDLHGHEAGDLILKESARRMRSCVRQTDTVARLGGDEFTIILSDLAQLDHVEFACQKLLAQLAEPFQVGIEAGYISASIGISVFPHDANDVDTLMRKADDAMYAAKRAGKNQFHYYTQEMDEKAHFRLRIANELRHALKQEQLTLHYQPVVDLKANRVVKAEALLRWSHPKLGQVSPCEFIPMAEESGLIRQIGNWVFREAANCCKRCSAQLHTAFEISINKSPMQFLSQDAEANWLGYLAEQGIPCSSISVEITEGVLLHASERIANQLTEYRDAGIKVALDDFGTGYASMAYLQKFAIDYVKIDQSFIRNLSEDPNSQTIAEAIIVMAHKLGKKVIAEGIETEEQLAFLISADCDYGQGFLLAHPLPESELIHLLENGTSLSLPA